MNILFCHNHYQRRSGEDIAFDNALSLLRGSGHHVEVFSRNNDEIAGFKLRQKALFPFRSVYSGQERRRMKACVEGMRPDVAIVQNVFPLLSPSIYDALRQCGVPVVQLVFNYRFLCINGLLFTQGQICERCVRGNYVHAVARRCMHDSYAVSAIYAASVGLHRALGTWTRCATLFVAPDVFLKNKLQEGGIPGEKIRVISNPFDASQYRFDYRAGRYALFVGQLIRPKGIFTLLEAILQTSDLHLIVIGDGPEAESVRAHPAVVQNRAEFLGPVYGEQARELLAGAAFVVVPSEWYDNLPMIVCQAFASGKPVVASRINGIPEFVKHEENGLLFTTGSTGELAAAMNKLNTDVGLQNKLARGARAAADTVLAPSLWVDRMNNVLTEAVQARTQRI